MVTLWRVSWSLRWRGLAHTQESLRRRSMSSKPMSADSTSPSLPSSSPTSSDTDTLVTAWEWAVRLAARNVPCRARCLEQSLTLWYLLRRHGVPSALRIGVRKAGGQTLEAHAWVELEGRPINDRPDIALSYAAFEGPLPSTAEVR